MRKKSIIDEYFALLKAHIARPREEHLAGVAGLGRELIVAGVPLEEIGEIHEEALRRLAEGHPDTKMLDTIRRTSAPLMETLMAYGLAFREQFEECRRVEEEQIWLVTAVEQAAEAVVITDTDGTIRYVNPAFESITGFSREEAIGRNHRIIKSGEHKEDFYQELWGTITQGKVWTGHFINRKKDGTLYEEDATISPIRNASGKIVKYVAVKRDVTQEVALAAQFHQAQKMEAVGRLAGGVAHDFNNILNVILVYSGFMKGELPPDDPWRKDIEEIEQAARHAMNLTRSLLAFSRRQIMSPQPLNLNDVVRGMGRMLERFVGEDIELRLDLDENLEIVSADWSQIELVLMNLVVNARDAMPQGGRLTIGSSNVVLDENYADQHKVKVPPGPYILLTISDTGLGMTEEVRKHIFEPFFTTKEIDKGTGLGLATIYGIVKQSNGYIWVYSEPGMGTTFKIYLPGTGRAGEKIADEGQLASYPPTNGETILLVEDDEGMRKVASRILSGGGYRVIEAGDPDEAEKKFREDDGIIGLLLTDVIMPDGNGHELARKLIGLNPELKILYMSGYSDEIIAHHGIIKEGIRVVQKPFPAKDLLKQVRKALDSK
jgi:two-component system cell cycle sensor histidine kinase/response regulator CckA